MFFYSAKSQSEREPTPALSRILLVFDASQSMYGRWQSDKKINIAKKILGNLLDSLQRIDNVQVALRVYGHQYPVPPQVCTDTKLVVPFKDNNIAEIKEQLRLLDPKGTTPIAYSLQEAAYDFPVCDNCRNIIILITDGIEACDGDPCSVSFELQKKGIALRPFIIGIGTNFAEAFDCVGSYFDATDEAGFTSALKIIISQALNPTTAQVNLLDQNNKPTETNVAITLYDHISGKIKYNFIHTMNSKGVPDTLLIDPLITYDMVAHTIPPVRVDSIKLTPGKHTIMPAKTPQGSLELKIEATGFTVKDLKCIIRKDGNKETLNLQQFGESEQYLTGIYDLEILSLPRIYQDNVEIKQSHKTTVSIPAPGILVFERTSAGYASLLNENNSILKNIYTFTNTGDRETLLLQPGRYRIVFRSKYSPSSSRSVEQIFDIESGKTTHVKLY